MTSPGSSEAVPPLVAELVAALRPVIAAAVEEAVSEHLERLALQARKPEPMLTVEEVGERILMALGARFPETFA